MPPQSSVVRAGVVLGRVEKWRLVYGGSRTSRTAATASAPGNVSKRRARRTSAESGLYERAGMVRIGREPSERVGPSSWREVPVKR